MGCDGEVEAEANQCPSLSLPAEADCLGLYDSQCWKPSKPGDNLSVELYPAVQWPACGRGKPPLIKALALGTPCSPGTFLSTLPPNGGNSVKRWHNLNSDLHFINNDNIYFNGVKSE